MKITITENMKIQIAKDYSNGVPACKIAKNFGTSTGVITKHLKNMGMTLRSHKESIEGRWQRNKHPWIGKKHDNKTKLKMSENHADVSGINNPNYKGRGKFSEDGAWLTYDASGYLRRTAKSHPLSEPRSGLIGEHVYQACLKCGIEQVDGKDVHHLNGNKEDNSWDNLALVTRSEHISMENKLRQKNKAANNYSI